jgi:hypothetical protein
MGHVGAYVCSDDTMAVQVYGLGFQMTRKELSDDQIRSRTRRMKMKMKELC